MYINIPVKKIQRANKFYSELFVQDYNIIATDQKDQVLFQNHLHQGTIIRLKEELSFIPDMFGVTLYFKCGDNLEDATNKVRSLGGRYLSTHDDENFGKILFCYDSEGNKIALY